MCGCSVTNTGFALVSVSKFINLELIYTVILNMFSQKEVQENGLLKKPKVGAISWH